MGVTFRLILHLFLFIQTLGVLAAPISPSPVAYSPLANSQIIPRDPVLRNSGGRLDVFDPETRQIIPQAPATDGGGSTTTSVPNLMWLVFSLLIGCPMAFAGVRGRKCTTGTGIGLAGAVCVWAGFINTMAAPGISDALLSGLVIGAFCVGFVIGCFQFGRLGGIACLGITGGLAVGIRLVILKDGLLVSATSAFAANWVLIGFLGGAGGLCMIWWQRAGIVAGSASVGTFLLALAIDLMANRQAGMSRGLRFLFDRNPIHMADLLGKGYKSPLSSKLIILASVLLIPPLAYAQHRIFSKPFQPEDDRADLNSLNLNDIEEKPRRMTMTSTWKAKFGGRTRT